MSGYKKRKTFTEGYFFGENNDWHVEIGSDRWLTTGLQINAKSICIS